MAITRTNAVYSAAPLPDGRYRIYPERGRALAITDTPAEAATARLAFERVMLPRFTADEAIEQLKATENHEITACFSEDIRDAYMAGARWALEALAAAGVFVPDDASKDCECRQGEACKVMHFMGPLACHGRRNISCPRCLDCNGTGRVTQTMADKLNAAGIR